ncbi:divalent-cation tolerance protein CutA [Sphingopyxis sp. MWB1]|uniref:divalent-cation tolerance protein CutA n=1 Tax=Sphingopyxis sp. MWB1 TaxID=1537715 RepID=UPI00051A81B2|nr:divalent-cation tolerance protein CutA [Sphingopyxis sp. MWB1]
MNGGRCIVITTTVGSAEAAERIADAVIAERLAACVQSWPISSRYRWQGAVAADSEIRLEMKTINERAEALVARVAALHPYELPEILVASVAASEAYAAWVEAETR